MKLRHLCCSALLLLAPLASYAFVPENGFYQQYTPDNSSGGGGTGISIEIQNEYMFAAGYVYTAAGAPTFVTMQGKLVLQSDGTWTLSTSASDPTNGLAAYANGQCIGSTANCPYKAPTATKIGDFGIQFLGESLATLTWGSSGNLASTTLERFHFFTGSSEAQSLLGQWDILIDSSTSTNLLDYSGDRFVMFGLSSPDSTGKYTLGGCVPNNNGTPYCTSRNITGTATPCSGLGCFGNVNYQLAITYGTGAAPIIRVYDFSSNTVAGAFTQSFYGTVHFCPTGASSNAQCTASSAHFNAYRSGSSQYSNTGVGMHQP